MDTNTSGWLHSKEKSGLWTRDVSDLREPVTFLCQYCVPSLVYKLVKASPAFCCVASCHHAIHMNP